MFEKKGDLFGVHGKASKHSFSVDDYLQIGMISRFIFEMQSDALIPHISEKDLLIVDRALTPSHGDYILASLNDHFVCRRFEKTDQKTWLTSRFGKQEIKNEDDILVFGVIVAKVRKFR